jgi:hypothetical protein
LGCQNNLPYNSLTLKTKYLLVATSMNMRMENNMLKWYGHVPAWRVTDVVSE